MMNMAYYTERLLCSNEEKRECLEAVHTLYHLSWIAHQEGLLAIEEELYQVEDGFLKACMNRVIDARCPESVEQLGLNLIMADNDFGKAFLKKVCILDGVLKIQQGIFPTRLVRYLSCWFGADFLPIYKEEFSFAYQEDIAYCQKVIDRCKKENMENTSQDMDWICRLDNRSMQRLMQEMGMYDMALAVKNTSAEVIDKFVENMSKIARYDFCICLDRIQSESQYIKWAQKRIADTAKKLASQGELILYKFA